MKTWMLLLCVWLATAVFPGDALAIRLVDVLPVDRQCLMVHFQDGTVHYKWDHTEGPCPDGWGVYHGESHSLCRSKDAYIPYGEPLETAKAKQRPSFLLWSPEDDNYGQNGKTPVNIHRKSKVWEASQSADMPAMHHWLYLELPSPLVRGRTYVLDIDGDTNTDRTRVTILFDEYAPESPSIRISHLGYEAGAVHKMADVYLWMGDGGGRDFGSLDGAPFHLYDANIRRPVYSGNLRFRMKHGREAGFDKDFTMADVWECDFSSFNTLGRYKLVIEGMGSSPVFPIGENLFEVAFQTAMQGMFYQRMGCEEWPVGGFPPTRRPLYKQGSGDPEGFTVYVSNRDMVTGRNPDDLKWYAADSTDRIVPETWGGWADAYDNDQRPWNYICVFDILLMYYLSPESFHDGQLFVTKSEAVNGIPDILDEALWEIDWFLRMRDPQDGGYLTGLCNITPNKPDPATNYAGAAVAWQGWNVAAACAMVADCFRLAGLPERQQKYTEAAIEAYTWAGRQEDPMLDTKVSGLRSRDLKMTAAAFLFNLTGAKEHEEVVKTESVVTGPSTKIQDGGKWQQQYASVAYLLSPQEVSHPALQAEMKASLIRQARTDHVDPMAKSQTKAARAAVKWEGMCQTSNDVSMVAIAHRLTDRPEDRRDLERALYSEAEWTLGRNPLGRVQMTGLTERAVTQTYATGRRDSVPGLTPGWTPFMGRDGWRPSMHIGRCPWYTSRNYPENKEIWPWGEHYWNSRYAVANAETTPQQTMRQKVVLYGYLFGLSNTSRSASGLTSGGSTSSISATAATPSNWIRGCLRTP
jgi:hypothetical protein